MYYVPVANHLNYYNKTLSGIHICQVNYQYIPLVCLCEQHLTWEMVAYQAPC